MSLKRRVDNYVNILFIMTWDHVQVGGVSLQPPFKPRPTKCPLLPVGSPISSYTDTGIHGYVTVMYSTAGRPSPKLCDVESDCKLNTSVTTCETREIICINE
jgi:hypothetical protein